MEQNNNEFFKSPIRNHPLKERPMGREKKEDKGWNGWKTLLLGKEGWSRLMEMPGERVLRPHEGYDTIYTHIRKGAWHTCIRYTLLIYDH